MRRIWIHIAFKRCKQLEGTLEGRCDRDPEG
jgi:hypothetical protein